MPLGTEGGLEGDGGQVGIGGISAGPNATDGQIPVYSGSSAALVMETPPSLVASGPGGVAGGNSGSAFTVPNPASSTGFGMYHATLNSATVTVTMPTATVGQRFVLRLTQDVSGSRAVAFAASPPVVFPALALNVNQQAYAENWIAFECGFDNGGNPTWYGFPGTSAIVNSLLEMCKVVATTNQASRSGTPTINGYATVAGDRVLLTGQSTQTQNGPWVVAAGAWTRPADYPTGYALTAAIVPISSSDNTYAGTLWFLSTQTAVVIDTGNTSWTQVPGTPIGTATPLVDSTSPVAGSTTIAAGQGHVHPRYHWTASDFGYITATFPPEYANAQSAIPTSGTIYGGKLHLPVAASITNVIFYIVTAGGTLTSGQCFAALYQAGTQIGVTADQSGTWTSTGFKTMALASGPFNVSAGDIQVVFFSNGTTNPRPAAAASAGIVNGALSNANSKFFSADTGRTTTMPGTLAAASAYGNSLFLAVS